MPDQILYIRYYNQDLYPEYSGIAIGNSVGNWEIITNKFSQIELDKLVEKYPQAQLQNFPLPDNIIV
jgi:hypothetical protein